MARLNEHMRAWRVTLFVLLLVAIIGPWIFDRISVPSEYSCSAPAVRLEGDFCGIPMSGMWILMATVGVLVNIFVGWVTGTTVFPDRAGELLFGFLGLLLVLPFFSILFLILREGSRGRFIFNVVALGLAVGTGLLLAMVSYPNMFWVLWGLWLYVGLAACALILEIAMLALRRRHGDG